MSRSSIMVVSLLALVAFLAVAPAALAEQSPFSTLVGSADFPAASGKAKMDVILGALFFRVEVDDVPQLAGAELHVLVADIDAGTLTIDALGAGRLEVAVGADSPISAVPAGTPVEVRTDIGELVVSGTAP